MPNYTDNLTYGVLVEIMPDGERLVRQRKTVWDWTAFALGADVVAERLVEYHGYRGNRVEYLVGNLGEERLWRFADETGLYEIDGSGVPAMTCAAALWDVTYAGSRGH